MIFDAIHITAIEAGAFNKRAFQQLRTLKIYNLVHIIEYHEEMFDGLWEVLRLQIQELTPARWQPPVDLLRPFNEYMEFFFYEGDIGDAPVLTDLFGRSKLLSLHTILMNCFGWSRFGTMAANNFTGLPAIREINLVNCGIVSIEIGAFDEIAKTLIALHFIANPLLQLSLDHFRYYLDKWPAYGRHVPKHLLLFYPGDLPYQCSLEFYRIRNMTMISFHYAANNMKKLYCENDIHLANVSAQPPQQLVHPKRWHLNHSLIHEYVFRKFQLRFDAINRTMFVSQFDSDDYRLFVWPINRKTLIGKRKCPLAADAKCQRRRKPIETIAGTELRNDSGLIAACVIHISMRKESVPMHCQTIRLDLDVDDRTIDDFVFNWLYYGLAMLIGTVVLIPIGISVVKCSDK